MESFAPDKFESSGWFKDLLIIAALSAVLYLSLAFVRPLASPDEGRYSEIPREMVAGGDYVSPTLNGMAYFYKPPMCYWMQAASIKCFGINLFSLRLANSGMAILGILMTYCAARSLFGRRAGMASAAVLSTSVLYFALGQIVTLDMTVSVFITGAMFSFITALRKDGFARGFLILLFFAMCALAVMSKGLIGVLIPSAIIFLYAMLTGVFYFVKSLKPSDFWWASAGVVLFAAIAVPWHVLTAMANPPYQSAEGIFSKNWEGQGFFWYYIVHEHFLRYIDADTSMRAQPWWFFFVFAVVGVIPWAIVAPRAFADAFSGGIVKFFREKKELAFMLVWAVFVVLFFSVSKSKLVPYIIPIFPAAAVVIGVWVAKVWENPQAYRLKIESALFVVLGYAIAAAPFIIYFVLDRKGKLYDHSEMAALCAVMTAVLAAAASFALYANLKMGRRAFMAAVFAAVFCLLMFFNPLGKFLQRPSAQPLAEAYLKIRKGGDKIFVGINYGAFQDLPVWLNDVVLMIGGPPEEQKYGYMRAREKNEKRFFETGAELRAFVAEMKGDAYLAVRNDEFPAVKEMTGAKFTEIARNRDLVLYKMSF